MLIECDGVTALNANDNTLTIQAAKNIKDKYGSINLAMLNYNAAGPYPSCFDNLTESEKFSEHSRLLLRNYGHMDSLLKELKPKAVLPFAGSYVLGGHMHKKNQYLGTATWDECAKWIIENGVTNTKIVLLRENDVLNIDTGIANKEYIPLDKKYMDKYISDIISKRKYPYELDAFPEINELIADLKIASENLKFRMGKFKIKSSFAIILQVQDTYYEIYPNFQEKSNLAGYKKYLLCNLDLRLLSNILHKKSHWNNAEIGAHITFIRQPNIYEPDLHVSLQFLHL